VLQETEISAQLLWWLNARTAALNLAGCFPVSLVCVAYSSPMDFMMLYARANPFSEQLAHLHLAQVSGLSLHLIWSAKSRTDTACTLLIADLRMIVEIAASGMRTSREFSFFIFLMHLHSFSFSHASD
jgi:hypothetical protein